MNKKEKQKILKQRFASQILTTIGILAVLGVALSVGIKILSWGRGIFGGGCDYGTVCAIVPGGVDFTVILGTVGIIGIVAGALLRPNNK